MADIKFYHFATPEDFMDFESVGSAGCVGFLDHGGLWVHKGTESYTPVASYVSYDENKLRVNGSLVSNLSLSSLVAPSVRMSSSGIGLHYASATFEFKCPTANSGTAIINWESGDGVLYGYIFGESTASWEVIDSNACLPKSYEIDWTHSSAENVAKGICNHHPTQIRMTYGTRVPYTSCPAGTTVRCRLTIPVLGKGWTYG